MRGSESPGWNCLFSAAEWQSRFYGYPDPFCSAFLQCLGDMNGSLINVDIFPLKGTDFTDSQTAIHGKVYGKIILLM
jgi:hypothetical protein